MAAGVTLRRNGEMQITSPPVVVHGVVIVGSSIDDNQLAKEISGAVRAFDAVTGAPRWTFDPLATADKSVVSGAANGIGLACVQRFVDAGASVACFDRDADGLERLGTRFEGSRLSLSAGDVTSTEDVERAILDGVDAFGGLDGVVNAAGIDLLRSLEDTGDEPMRSEH